MINLIQKALNEQFARSAAKFMKGVCYVLMALGILCLILSILGRQTFSLRTSTDFYDRAIYAEEDHDPTSRSFTVSMTDDVFVTANGEDGVDLGTQAALTLMYALTVLPLAYSYWLLSRVFRNVSEGRIFTDQNASCLLYYGLIRFGAAILVPLGKVLTAHLANLLTESQIRISTGSSMLNTLIPSIAFIVAAYIIHYGIHLQDEVDHTL